MGQNGVVFHFDGTSWSPIAEPNLAPLNGVSALPGEDALAVGFVGTIRRRAGNGWVGEDITETLPSGRVSDFHGVALLGGGRAFAVGGEMLKPDLPRHGAIAFRSVDALPTPVIGACAEAVDGGAVDAASPDLFVADLHVALDSAPGDAGDSLDASVDLPPPDLTVPIDQTLGPDMAGLKANAPCPDRGGCAEGLECWEIGFLSNNLRCTHYCKTPSDCGDDFGPNPQCAAPGCQALGFSRCISQGLVGCALPDMASDR